MAIDYRSELNDSQLEAVLCCDAPSLVIAGAGSGKTRVLTYKVAYLLENYYEPYNILALTFTNKAADEMRQRISSLVGEEKARRLWMGTFHSVFARILRRECDLIGYTADYTIYDMQDSQSLLKQIIKEEGLDDKRYKPSVVAKRISEAKNNMLTASGYANSSAALARDQASRMEAVRTIFAAYEKRLKASNAMDFDDLLLNTYRLFLRHEDVRQRYQALFQYVLVDEYQDTNRVQHQIVLQLTEAHHRVCVVGDDAQSIYSFRGAVVDNILSFQHLYPGTRTFKLERNYRSTQSIVAAANSLIAHNSQQIRKDVYSKRAVGEPVEVCEAYSDKEEASIVSRKIEALRFREGFGWSDFAVLYRTNSQSRAFEEEFRRRGFQYRIVGGLSFYQRKEVKDAVAYFRLSVNLHDEASLNRILNVPGRGIGDTTKAKVFQCADRHGVPAWEVVAEPRRFSLNVNEATCRKLLSFAEMMQEANSMASEKDAHSLALHLVRVSGLRDDIFQGREPEDIARQENLQELLDGAASFVSEANESGYGTSMVDYLQNISLLSDIDEGENLSGERVTLMTMHSAKGLEFKAVFVVGLEEGLFPSMMADGERSLEEERRLFYVAMTRAEERLFLTWSHSRMRYGRIENNPRSRFLGEISGRYLTGDRPASASYAPQRRLQPSVRPAPAPTPSPSPSSVGGLKVGAKVEHARFGIGIVRQFEGEGLDAKAIVDFGSNGEKRLLLRFARLTPLGD
ncbi:MAG: UvrD-helicase domain-containing protein [Prevotellaceae bacterium]|nr:UvrD-helicase domain-containing protein [Prevotellaceae bacterium]